MKRYFMFRNHYGGRARANVSHPDGSVTPLRHLVHHSPDGFEWGYGGSGPADLARSIVGDVLQEADPSPHLYQAVKFELVARLPWEGGEITEERVREILEAAEVGALEGP